MRVLIESDSLIQFLIAAHIRTTVYKDANVDLVMYDSMPAARKIYENIKKSNLFDNCYLVSSVLAVGVTKLTRLQKVEKILSWIEMLANPDKGVKRILVWQYTKYDVFLFCANGIFIDGLYNVCYKTNPEIICQRYEGSITSYIHDHENKKGKYREKFERIVKKAMGYRDLALDVETYYFFEPELIQFHHSYKIKRIDKITTMAPDVIRTLNSIFEFQPDKDIIAEDFIAFEDGNLYFLNDDTEVETYVETAKILGDNFIVRLHPRRGQDRFIKMGVKTQRSVAPWEIYLLNQKINNKTLITVASGSVFTSLIYFGMSARVIYLNDCVEVEIPLINSDFERLIQRIQEKFEGVIVPQSFDEYYEILKGIGNQ